ncbi:hypothetical protein [Actinosynnema mirum]|uniref:Uncharacterized protein n=1 Tax=Actinosynnema mirum (strain ATCC 29888 / DSM 43827 / JCM 3225 / NBRC 14064 / NCIMB 13271 / NRRL B-12336 / IMRU 3971 / 101) TaxID=446462 RepID=C6WC42_ACTMD|nr:hypothetical protein [Actinosynnema mirum]ACU39430.1 hypothetical protein Amir_5614 [Actinosynnema mirum DSM 43827]
MIAPQNFRVIGEMTTETEMYIPVSGPRHRAALEAVFNPQPPTAEQVQAAERASEEREQARLAEMAEYEAQHADLLTIHSGSSIITALLNAHAPQAETLGPQQVIQECGGCPEQWDRDYSGSLRQPWPCPTWLTISEGSQ